MESVVLPVTSDNSKNQPAVLTDIDTLKSVYYWLNAKPDTQIKVFHKPKRVTIEDIKYLNDKVQKKLRTHNVFSNITSVNIIFKDGDIRTYSAWEEFMRFDEGLPSTTESVSINWDINIQLPNYHYPQRHTLKVRIGSSVRPSEFFHLLANNDNDVELQESMTFIVAKVDFVNSVIANELLQNVKDWYSCLPSSEEGGKFQNFVEKRKTYIARFVHYIMPTIALTLLYVVFKALLLSRQTFVIDQSFIISAYGWLLITLVVGFGSYFVGIVFGNEMLKKISSYSDTAIFGLTLADKNSIEEIRKKNSEISSGLRTQIILMLVGTLLSVILTEVIEKLMSILK